MGQGCTAICKDCGNEFTANIGGGFFFHLLHCYRCGKEKEIGFDELREIHLQYLRDCLVHTVWHQHPWMKIYKITIRANPSQKRNITQKLKSMQEIASVVENLNLMQSQDVLHVNLRIMMLSIMYFMTRKIFYEIGYGH